MTTDQIMRYTEKRIIVSQEAGRLNALDRERDYEALLKALTRIRYAADEALRLLAEEK